MKGNQHITSNLAELTDRQRYLGPHIYTATVNSYIRTEGSKPFQ